MRTIKRLFILLLLLASIGLLIWGFWPYDPAVQTLPIDPGDLQLPTPESWLPAMRAWF